MEVHTHVSVRFHQTPSIDIESKSVITSWSPLWHLPTTIIYFCNQFSSSNRNSREIITKEWVEEDHQNASKFGTVAFCWLVNDEPKPHLYIIRRKKIKLLPSKCIHAINSSPVLHDKITSSYGNLLSHLIHRYGPHNPKRESLAYHIGLRTVCVFVRN